jgi:Radical SAM superfamily
MGPHSRRPLTKRFRVLLIYPRRDPDSQVRTQFSQERIHGLLLWPFRPRTYGLAFNGLETLASLTPDWVDLSIVNENLDDIDFNAAVDLVAITVMVTNATRACQIGDRFRARGVKVVMGGYFPYMVPDHALRHADAICASEAESVWATMLADARDNRLETVYTQPDKTDMSTLTHRPRRDRWRWLRHVTLTLQASRGCPFDCEFCSIVQMLGHEMRYKRPDAVVAELETIYRHDLLGRVAGRHIFFVDDNIFGNPKQFKAICRAIIGLNKRYPRFRALFGSQLTINVSKDREALALMQEAGFYNIFIGLESTNVDVLRSYNKLHNLAFNYDEAIARIREYGMEVIASFIFGTDGDTPECFEHAFQFFDRNNVLYPYFNILTPIGRQWKRFLMEGRILTVKPRLYDAHHTVFVPMKMRPLELQQGFIDLVDRVFSYEQITKRLRHAPVRQTSARMRMSRTVQTALYYKLLATLKLSGDAESLGFLRALRTDILKDGLPLVPVLIQLDQHDFAVHNRLTLAEHRYNLDVPSWEERPRSANAADSIAAEVAAAVR